MNKKDIEKALKTLSNFKERAKKLSDKAEEWEVNLNLNKAMKKMGIPLEFSTGNKMSKKGREKLIKSVIYKLSVLKNHFSSVHRMVEKNPTIWDKKIESNEKKLGRRISFYEKITPILFRKKKEIEEK